MHLLARALRRRVDGLLGHLLWFVVQPLRRLVRHLLVEGLDQRRVAAGLAAVAVLLDGVARRLRPVRLLLVAGGRGDRLQHQRRRIFVEPGARQEATDRQRCVVTRALCRPVPRQHDCDGKAAYLPQQLVVVDGDQRAVLVPLDRLAALVRGAGENRLRSLAAAADLQFEHHGAVDILELQASLGDLVGQRGAVEPVRARLRRASEDIVARGQQHRTDRPPPRGSRDRRR